MVQRSFPDYYETIKHPMCLEMVDKKLKAKEYETLKDVIADLGQIFNNAKRCKSAGFQGGRMVTDVCRQHEGITPLSVCEAYARECGMLFHPIALALKGTQKVVRTFYADITNPGEAEPDSDHEELTSSVPPNADGAATTAAQADVSMDVDEEHDPRGVSEGMDGESGMSKKKRGGYMREGPTVYKLIKPVLKSIKEAKSLEYVSTRGVVDRD